MRSWHYISDGAPHRCFASTSERAAVASFRGSRPCSVVRPALVVAREPRARFGMREDAASPSSVAPTCRHWARRARACTATSADFATTSLPGRRRTRARRRPTRDRGPRYSRRTHLRNRNKAGDFRRWLLETFGAERLASGAGVLDVAGGKGELAFELLNISGVPVTVVDPRQMRLDKYVRRFRSGLYHRNRAPAVRACARRPPDASLAAPAHLRLYFHAGLWTGTRESRRDAAEASWTLAHATRWSRRGLVEGEERPVDPEETNARDVAYRRPGAPVRQRRALDPPPRRESVSRISTIRRSDDDRDDDRGVRAFAFEFGSHRGGRGGVCARRVQRSHHGASDGGDAVARVCGCRFTSGPGDGRRRGLCAGASSSVRRRAVLRVLERFSASAAAPGTGATEGRRGGDHHGTPGGVSRGEGAGARARRRASLRGEKQSRVQSRGERTPPVSRGGDGRGRGGRRGGGRGGRSRVGGRGRRSRVVDTRGASVRFPAASRRATTRRVSACESAPESLVVGEIHPTPSGASRRIHAGRVRAVNAACALSYTSLAVCIARSRSARPASLGPIQRWNLSGCHRNATRRRARAKAASTSTTSPTRVVSATTSARRRSAPDSGNGTSRSVTGRGWSATKAAHARSWARQRTASAGARGRARGRGVGVAPRACAQPRERGERRRRPRAPSAPPREPPGACAARERRPRGATYGRRATTRRARRRSRATSASQSAASSAARAAARASLGRRARRVVRPGIGPRARVVVSPRSMAPDERASGRRNARRERVAVGRAPRHAAPRARAFLPVECVTRESQGIFCGVEVFS